MAKKTTKQTQKALTAKDPRANIKTKTGKKEQVRQNNSRRAGFENAVSDAAPRREMRERFKDSHKHIQEAIVTGNGPSSRQEIDITKDIGVSKLALEEYVTLDWQHFEEIKQLIKKIYEYTKDPTRRRPLNIIMQAEPGSGKSHFIESLAKKIARDGLKEVTFNMSSLRSVDDFIHPLEEVRNIKVVDKIPLLFLDEFDSNENNYSLLLPLLWDGALGVGQRRLRIGKVVTILAGSSKKINEVMKNAKGMQPETNSDLGKLADLLSRINGGEFTIPGLDDVDVNVNRDRRVDKVCLTISLLARRFPSLTIVPWALLRFIAETKFRYGVRSISHLIDLIPSHDEKKTVLTMEELQFPLHSVADLKANSLAFHLIDEYGPAAVIETWRRLQSNRASVKFKSSSTYDELVRKFFEEEPQAAN